MSSNPEKKELYRRNDIIIILCGLPVVATFAVFCANFITTYAGL